MLFIVHKNDKQIKVEVKDITIDLNDKMFQEINKQIDKYLDSVNTDQLSSRIILELKFEENYHDDIIKEVAVAEQNQSKPRINIFNWVKNLNMSI